MNLDSANLDEPFINSDDVLDVVSPSEYQAGDLVELANDATRDVIMAICLGYINGAYHLFTQNGEWRVALNFKSRFVISNFANTQVLEPVIARLPKEQLSFDEMSKLAESDFGPDRAAGKELLTRMVAFLQATEEVTQKFGVTLDKIHLLLIEADAGRYFTLKQIHTILFRGGSLAPANPIVMYAIHRAVTSDHLCFRTVGFLEDAKTLVFEAIPDSDVALIDNLQTHTRMFTDLPGQTGKSLSSLTPEDWQDNPIGSFILKARDAIDHSRKSRDFTQYGMVGPARLEGPADFNPGWTRTDLNILHFMRLWTCHDHFPATSTYHWIGSAILRATGKYADSEYLSPTVGWTFLQETGYIAPWDLHKRHLLRLPEIETSRFKGFEPLWLKKTDIEGQISQHDMFPTEKRHNWKNVRAFAIDSKDTVDVDDAVSIEATDDPEVTWVHIHVADPASRVKPNSDLAKRAEKTPLTLYLSGHETNMWGIGSELRELFSLGPKRPCLTFSGKVNLRGELLDRKITPGILGEMVYMTPEEVNKAVGSHDLHAVKMETFSVGKPPSEKPAGRPMTAAPELQQDDLKSLKLLQKVAEALEEKRLAKGAMPVFPPEPSVKASFADDAIRDQTLPDKEDMEGILHCKGDPFIEIGWPKQQSLLVASNMRLAGEIAAQWCGERNIPLPYLTQPQAQMNLAVLRSYADNHYYPRLLKDEATVDESAAFSRLLGLDKLSTQPGPHFLMGVDGYAKVTSPLRRYSDLLAHWQIEDALLQEYETGSVDVSKLPFQAETLESDVFPWMRLRQRIIRGLSKRSGTLGYVLQAVVRAWKYPDQHSSPIPKTFRFTVKGRVYSHHREVHGVLDWFKMPATMSVASLPKLGVQAANLKIGDVLEVRLTNVNVHLETMFVDAVRKVKVAADEAE